MCLYKNIDTIKFRMSDALQPPNAPSAEIATETQTSQEPAQNLRTIVYVHSHLIGQFTNMIKAFNGRYNQIFVCCIAPELEDMNNIVSIGNFDEKSPEKNGSNILEALAMLRNKQIVPDIFITQVGTGVGLYLHTLYPNIPRIGFVEWFFPGTNTSNLRKNDMIRKELDKCSIGIAPTINQKNRFPPDLRQKIMVVHEGIDTDIFIPNPAGNEIPSPADLDEDEKKFLITYISRGLEPLRGFLEFVKGVKKVFEAGVPIRVKIAGQDKVFYDDNPDDISFQMEAEKILGEHMEDVEFLGSIKRPEVRDLMQKSDLHVYFTNNYTLSWSFLEAMIMGCLVLGSNTPPVQEFIKDGENGKLVDFQEAEKVKNAIIEMINMDAENLKKIKSKARETTLARVDKNLSMIRWEHIVQSLASSTIHQY